MANSGPVASGQQATATQYNNLRSDVLDPATGHAHDGTSGGGTAIDRPWLGTGADGNVTIAADTVLTRDMHYASLTVSAGVHLDTNGYRIFCRGTVNVLGTVEFDLTDYPWTTLSSAMDASTPSIVLSGYDVATRRHGWGCFNTSNFVVLKVDSEIIYACHLAWSGAPGDKTQPLTCTNGVNSASLARGMAGTAAAAHSAGAKVYRIGDGEWGASTIANGSPVAARDWGVGYWSATGTRTTPLPLMSPAGSRGALGISDPHVGSFTGSPASEVGITAGGATAGASGAGGDSSGHTYPGSAGYGTQVPSSKTNMFSRGVPRSALEASFLSVGGSSVSAGTVSWYAFGLEASSAASGGAGGSGGASSGQPPGGGGGGAGVDGGTVIVACRTLAGNGTIRSLGGSGGAGGRGKDGPGAAGGGGGGAGGGGGCGGLVLLVYTVKTFSGTLSAAGGAGGAGGGGGATGTGFVGTAGGNGATGVTGNVVEIVA